MILAVEVVPSPKSQCQEVELFALLSVNWTTIPAFLVVNLALKQATGTFTFFTASNTLLSLIF
jgi:hypothetical protein